MKLFFISVIVLIVGYFLYGKLVDRLFGADPSRRTPAVTREDGVDYVLMPPWKIFLIQLLNIAGLGPIYGAILGALYGPVALLWIVFGCILGGAVHDYFSGMLSVRHDGQSLPDCVGHYLGNSFKQFMRGFSVILLILVGVVFFLGPAELLASLTGINRQTWTVIIIAYYFLATIMPVDKIIGRIYPLFGAVLIFMALGTITMLMVKGYELFPVKTFENINPSNLPLWPLMFITIACGAISGFHATQSPMMARCLSNERYGMPVFYGSMIAEGIIALIWATLAMSFFPSPEALNDIIVQGGPGLVVDTVSKSLLGQFGGILAIIGVIALPVTSGDTAFRSARLVIADVLNVSQKAPAKRLLIAAPLFVIGIVISFFNFDMIWRYFGWANQTLAVFVLWTSAAYLSDLKRFHWIATVPAVFMTAVVVAFIANSTIGFNLPIPASTALGVASAIAALWLFLLRARRVSGLQLAAKVAATLLLSFMPILGTASVADAGDLTGTWKGVVQESSSTCKDIVRATPGLYTLNFKQEGNIITVVNPERGVLYTGGLDPTKPGLLTLKHIYAEDGGIMAEEVKVRFIREGEGEGTSSWKWANAWHQCKGEFKFTLKKAP
jgi:carbon starvation protein CstA